MYLAVQKIRQLIDDTNEKILNNNKQNTNWSH